MRHCQPAPKQRPGHGQRGSGQLDFDEDREDDEDGEVGDHAAADDDNDHDSSCPQDTLSQIRQIDYLMSKSRYLII